MTESYCTECDAPPGGCKHTSPRYLDSIVYEPALDGWRIPGNERERCENPVRATRPRTAAPQSSPPSLQLLIVELEAWIVLEDNLERLVRADYEHEPIVTARLIAATIDGAKAGRLKNPGGYLYKQLKQRLERPAPD